MVGADHEVGRHTELITQAGTDTEITEGRPVLGPEADHVLAQAVQQCSVAEDDLLGPLPARRGGLRPLHDVVDTAAQILRQADHDVFLGPEVVVQRGLGHAQPFGNLAQGGLCRSRAR